MKEIYDKGSFANRVNTFFADLIASVFGARLNYKIRYYHQRHHFPNFKNPQDLSERILAAMLKQEFLKYADYADKIKVRDYVKSKGLENILLHQYGQWEKAEDINWDELPGRFIIKANNGCGGHLICTDKATLDIARVNSLMDGLLQVDKLSRVEPHYAYIEPKILAEELMGDGVTLPEDYKFYCINGKVDHVMVVGDRESGKRKVITMSPDWKVLPYVRENLMPSSIPSKPDNFSLMLEYAEKLSSDFEFVRVDLYNISGTIYFGELTFSPNGGLMYSYTNEAIKEIGGHFKKQKG